MSKLEKVRAVQCIHFPQLSNAIHSRSQFTSAIKVDFILTPMKLFGQETFDFEGVYVREGGCMWYFVPVSTLTSHSR